MIIVCDQGITLKQEEKHLKIARILRGGSVDKQGLLFVGDIIHSVNGFTGDPLELKSKLVSWLCCVEGVRYDCLLLGVC